MSKSVILSKAAQLSFNAVSEYIFYKWGAKVAKEFVAKFQRASVLIATNTTIYMLIDQDKRIRRCVLTRHNVIYFREDQDFIVILAVFDTRQNPENVRNLLK